MARVLLVLLVVLPMLFAHELIVQDLMPGMTVTSSKPIYAGPDENEALEQDYYRIWVPENAVSVTLDFTSNNYYCSIYAYYRTIGLPCPNYQPYNDAACYDESQYLASGSSRTLYKSYYSGFRFITDGYWYIGVGRDSTYYADLECPYNITASFTTCPGVNETDWYGNGEVANCITKMQEGAVVVPGEWDVMDQDAGVLSFDVIIPDDTIGVFTVFVNSTDYYLDIYGYSWGPATYYGSEDGVYDYTSETHGGVTYYLHWYDTYAPRPGMYNVLIRDSYDEPFNATIKTWFTSCIGNTAGENCTGVVHDPTELGPFERTEESYDYWKFMVEPEGTMQISIGVSDVAGGGYGYVVWKAGGYPFFDNVGGYDNSYYYQSFSADSVVTVILAPQDGVRMTPWYVGVYTYTGPVTFTVNPSGTSTGHTASSTGSADTDTTIGGTTTSNTTATTSEMTTGQMETTSTSGSSTSGTSATAASTTTMATASTEDGSTTMASAAVAYIPSMVMLCVAALMAML